ncbi:MAG: patatin-like phospholipase family protein [Bacteroidota bacterium]
MSIKKSLEEHRAPGPLPKRILALDGGGVKGALTLGYLKKIESIIRDRYGKDALLCDYFDLIGGTSTGAIIAGGLVIGKSVDEILKIYRNLSLSIFPPKSVLSKKLSLIFRKRMYDHVPLENSLREHFKDYKMFGPELKTGFCAVTKRLDSNSIWPLFNHPGGKYAEVNNFYMRDVLRATSAAPSYFKPHALEVKPGEMAAFVDGGLSISNNPALQLFLLTTLKGFPYRWPIGKENLSIISIGTGSATMARPFHEVMEFGAFRWATSIPDYFMDDAKSWTQVMMQYLSNSPTAKVIDREIGDLSQDLLIEAFDYQRFNIDFKKESLDTLGLKIDFTPSLIESLREMSNAKNVDLLYEIGKKAAEQEVKPEFIV